MNIDDIRELMMKVSAHIIASISRGVNEVADKVVEAIAEKERTKRVLKYELYKTRGAFQFRLMPAYAPGHKEHKPEGCVFVECARATDKRKYEFKDKKITFALNLTDIGQMLAGLRSMQKSNDSISMVHDPGAGTDQRGATVKTFRIQRANNSNKRGFEALPTYFMEMTMDTNGEKYDVKIPVEPFEMKIIQELLTAAISQILYWS